MAVWQSKVSAGSSQGRILLFRSILFGVGVKPKAERLLCADVPPDSSYKAFGQPVQDWTVRNALNYGTAKRAANPVAWSH